MYVCMYICICTLYVYVCIYSFPKYWNSKDKIAFYILLLGVSTHMFYHVCCFNKIGTFRVSSPIWCEHKYWDSCLTGLSEWSAVNSSDIKSRECVMSVISIASAFWVLHLMMTHRAGPSLYGALSRIIFGGPSMPPIWLVIVKALLFTHYKSNTPIISFVCCSWSCLHVFTLLWFLIVTVANLQEWSGVNLHFNIQSLKVLSGILNVVCWKVAK